MNASRLISRSAGPVILAALASMITGCPGSPLETGRISTVAEFGSSFSGDRSEFEEGDRGDDEDRADDQDEPDNDGGADGQGMTDVQDKPEDVVVVGGEGVTAAQKRRAEQITSVFENDTIELQYAYIENINDGRGYTAGRAGFTTATGDLIVVVERYTAAVPANELGAFLPRLGELADAQSDSVVGLEGLPAAWARTAIDARFRAVQDAVVDEMYYHPAVLRWRDLGLKTALSQAALYDANIQHGDGADPDGLPAMIERAVVRAGGSPSSGVSESAWLAAFLVVRRETLANAFDPETRAAWALGADRPTVYEKLLADENFDMAGPIVINTEEHQATVP